MKSAGEVPGVAGADKPSVQIPERPSFHSTQALTVWAGSARAWEGAPVQSSSPIIGSSWQQDYSIEFMNKLRVGMRLSLGLWREPGHSAMVPTYNGYGAGVNVSRPDANILSHATLNEEINLPPKSGQRFFYGPLVGYKLPTSLGNLLYGLSAGVQTKPSGDGPEGGIGIEMDCSLDVDNTGLMAILGMKLDSSYNSSYNSSMVAGAVGLGYGF